MKVYFVNSTPLLVECLQKAIAEVSPFLPPSVNLSVVPKPLQLFLSAKEKEPMAIVTPANSFSFMGGGFDKAVLSGISSSPHKEREVELAIQNNTLLLHHGFLTPGQAHTVNLADIPHTNDSLAVKQGVTSLIQVPTMEIPEVILFDRVFYSTWAALGALTATDVEAAIFPGFGAGFGGVPPGTCARLMVGAIALWYMPAPSPLARSAAVLLYLRRKYVKLGKASDIVALEAYYTPFGKELKNEKGKESQHWPLPWHKLVKGLNWIESRND